MRGAQLVVYLLPSFLILAACGGGNDATETTTVTASASAQSTATTTAAGQPSPSSATAEDDLRVCGAPDGLETRGMPFFGTLKTYLEEGSIEIIQSEFQTQLLALLTIGAPAGLTDGSQAVNQASFDVKQAMRHLIRDTKALMIEVVDDVPKEEFEDFIGSFGDAVVACREAGYEPSWAAGPQ